MWRSSSFIERVFDQGRVQDNSMGKDRKLTHLQTEMYSKNIYKDEISDHEYIDWQF